VFESGEDAIAYASRRVADDADAADIYEVVLPTDVPEEGRNRAAIAALEMGEGHLIAAKNASVSDAEYEQARTREWDRAQKEGDYDTMLKILGL
jgi:hypothetical protein